VFSSHESLEREDETKAREYRTRTGELWHIAFVERECVLRTVVEHDLSHARYRRQRVAGEKMLDALDQGIEVRARVCAEADHQVVERPEGHRPDVSVGPAATFEPNIEPGRFQLVGERLVLSSMQAVLDRGGFETYDQGLMLLKRRFAPNPRGPQLGRFDAAVLAQTPFMALQACADL
jgi:hypothetical protein